MTNFSVVAKKVLKVLLWLIGCLLLIAIIVLLMAMPRILHGAMSERTFETIEGIYGYLPPMVKNACIEYASINGDKDLFNYLALKNSPADIAPNHELLCHCLKSKKGAVRYLALNQISERGGIPLSQQLQKTLFDAFFAAPDDIEKGDILAVMTVCCYRDKSCSRKIVELSNELIKSDIKHFEYSEVEGSNGSHIKIDGAYYTPQTFSCNRQ